MTLRTAQRALCLVASCGTLVLACSGRDASDSRRDADDPLAVFAGEHIERVSELGPVRAVVKVAPTEPRLGDPINLMLEVTSEPGVVVEMPDFGEALGRFSIARYLPRESMRDGKWVATQIYKLDAPMSGRQRIPPLRIEFVDERTGQASGQASGQTTKDPDGDSDGDGLYELLTEEIPIQVASTLPDDMQDAELAEPRSRLRAPSETAAIWTSVWFWLVVGLILGVGLALGLRYGLREARERRRESAYAVAMNRLGKLESRGLPGADEADEWYVELSSIIRHYLEDRYSLRAPELTTEEFLQVARGSGVLTVEHRKLLEDFLLRCDRVKFAGYAPDDNESLRTLDAARGFLEDTRPDASPTADQEARTTAAARPADPAPEREGGAA